MNSAKNKPSNLYRKFRPSFAKSHLREKRNDLNRELNAEWDRMNAEIWVMKG